MEKASGLLSKGGGNEQEKYYQNQNIKSIPTCGGGNIIISDETFSTSLNIENTEKCQEIKIQSCKFTNIKVKTEEKSIIYIKTSGIFISDSEFDQCFCDSSSGQIKSHCLYLDSIKNEGCNITNCKFINNGKLISDQEPGTTHDLSTIIYSSGTTIIRITNSEFTSNENIITGAININNNGEIELDSTTFSKYYGSVFIENINTSKIRNCTFDNNKMNENIKIQEGLSSDEISSSLYLKVNDHFTFINNTIQNHQDYLSCCIIINKNGAIEQNNIITTQEDIFNDKFQTVLIQECNFYNNKCTNNFEGGSIGLVIKSNTGEIENIDFIDCTFTKNGDKSKESIAGVFGLSNQTPILTFDNCIFESNEANEKSSLLNIKNGKILNIYNCKINLEGESGFLQFSSRSTNDKANITISSTTFNNMNKQNKQQTLTDLISIDDSTTNSQLDNLNIIDCTFKDISMNEETFLFNVNSDSLQFVDNTISISTDSKNNNLFHFKTPKMNQIIINSCNLNNGLVSLSSTKSTQTIFRDTVYKNHIKVNEQSILCSTTEEFICERCSFIYTQAHSSTDCYRAILIKQSSSATITNCIFKNCWGPPELDGHGICCINPNSAGNVLTISSCIFEECGNLKSVVYSENNEINYINNTITYEYTDDGATGLLINNICELFVDGCKFDKCYHTEDEGHQGGGIEYRSPSVDSPKESITIQNSEFISCDGRACAISLMPKHAHPTITNVTISNSKTCYYTLMIMITTTSKYSTEGEVIIQNTTFSDITNLENVCGSGIWYSTTSSNNDKLSIIDCNFVNTYAYGDEKELRSGGAIAIESEECSNYHVAISGCSFYNCRTVLYPGGGIAIETHKTVTITDCIFNKTYTESDTKNKPNLGSVIRVKYFENIGPCIMSNVTVAEVTTIGAIPGIYFLTNKPCQFLLSGIQMITVSTTHSDFPPRTLLKVDENISYFECVNSTFDQRNLKAGYTKGILLSNLHFFIDHCNFFRNGYPGQGQSRVIHAENPSKNAIDYTISSCKFTNCFTTGYSMRLDIRKLNFINNSLSYDSKDNTGGMYVGISCYLVVDSCNFTRCGRSNTDFGGGFRYSHNSQNEESVTVSNCIFDDCMAKNSAALSLEMYIRIPVFYNNTFKNIVAFYVVSFIYKTQNIIYDTFKVEKNTFQNTTNSAADCGGSGIWINNARAEGNVYTLFVEFSDCNFINDWHGSSGGAFGLGSSESVKPTHLTFNRCNFTGNSCNSANTKNGGGALWIRTSADCIIRNCTFIDNKSAKKKSDGGAIYASFTSDLFVMSITNTVFINNSCRHETSLGHIIYTPILYGSVSLDNCTIIDNGFNEKTPNSVINTQSQLLINNSTFSFTKKECSFSRAIFIGMSSPFTLYNSFITNCTCPNGEGGSVYFYSSDDRTNDKLEIGDTVFINNSASKGTELYLSVHLQPIITNCTFINKFINSDLIILNFFIGMKTPKISANFDRLHFINCSFNGHKVLTVLNEDTTHSMDEILLNECEFIYNEDCEFASLDDPKLTIIGSLFLENKINNYIFSISSEKETTIESSIFRNNKYFATNEFTADEIALFIIEKSPQFTISDTIFEEEINAFEGENNDIARGFILKANANMVLLNVSFINCSTFKYAIFLSDSFGNEINNQENEEEKTNTSIFSFTNSTSDNSGCIFIDKRLNKVIVFNSTIQNTINGLTYYPTTESNNEMSEFVEIESSTFESINNNSCCVILNGEINIRNNTIRKCSNSKGKGNANFCFYVHNKTKKEFNIEEFTFEDNINENLEENNNRWMNGGGIGFVLEILSIQKQQSSPDEETSNSEISETIDSSINSESDSSSDLSETIDSSINSESDSSSDLSESIDSSSETSGDNSLIETIESDYSTGSDEPTAPTETEEIVTINFINCRLISNKATGNGGAFAFFNHPDLTIDNLKIYIKFYGCEFEGNKCDQKEGNALFIDCDKIIIEKCTFKSHLNFDDGIDIENSVIHLHNLYHSEVMISESGFHDNEGMLLYIHNCSTEVTIKDSNIENNYATSKEISIIDIRTENEIHIVNNTFSHNEGYTLNLTANENVNIDNCKFERNMINKDKLENPASLLENKNEVQQHYCIIVNNEKSLKMNKCTFNHLSGGAVLSKVKEDISIYGCHFENKITEEGDSTTQNNEIATINVEENGGMISFEDCKFYDIKTTSIKTSENTNNLSIKNVVIERRSSFETQPSYCIDISSQQEFIINFSKIIGSGGIYFNLNHKITESININNIEIGNNKYGIILHPKANSNIGLKNFQFENFTFKKVQRAIDLKIIDYQISISRGRIEGCNNELFKALEGEESTHGIVEITLCDNSIVNNLIITNIDLINNHYTIDKANPKQKGEGGIGFIINTEEGTTKEIKLGFQMIGCKIISNFAKTKNDDKPNQNSGGGFFYSDENEKLNLESVLFDHCEFINNKASNKGGAVFIKGNNYFNSIIVRETTFENNEAQIEGGSIYMDSSKSTTMTATFTNNTINENKSNQKYGAFYISSNGQIIIDDCIFTENKAISESPIKTIKFNCGALYLDNQDKLTSISISNCTFDSNFADSNCGAFTLIERNKFQSILITDCEFTNNTAHENYGAFYIEAMNQCGPISIVDCNFDSNLAKNKGGAIGIDCTSSNSLSISFIDCTIQCNIAKFESAAVYVKNNNELNFDNCNFINNSASSKAIEENGIEILEGEANCGAMHLESILKDSILLIKNCTFDCNEADNNYNTLFIDSKGEGSSISIVDSSFLFVFSNDDTSAIFIGTNADIIFDKCIFINEELIMNNYTGIGPEIHHCITTINDKTFTLKSCSFTDLSVSSIILKNKQKIEINDCNFTNDFYDEDEINDIQGIATIRTDENEATISIENSNFINMKTTTIICDDKTKSISIENCTIERLKGIENQPLYAIICSCQERFEVNKLKIESSGGVYFNSTMKLADFIIFDGIEISNNKYGIICSSKIEEETSLKSFRLENYLFYHLQQALNIKIKDCEVYIDKGKTENCTNDLYKNPKGEEKHGIIEINIGESISTNKVYIGNAEFINNEYIITRNNKNEKGGGGIGLVITTTKTKTNKEIPFNIEMINCKFISNYAKTNNEEVLTTSSGGGFYFPNNIEEEDNKLMLESAIFNNCQFKNNTASNKGGAIYIENNPSLKIISIRDTLIYNNEAKGESGSIFIGGGEQLNPPNLEISFINNSMINNTSRQKYGCVFIESSNKINIDSCSFINNTASLLVINDTNPTDTNPNNDDGEKTLNGGAIYINSMPDSSLITLINNYINNNFAEGDFGALFINAKDSSSSSITLEKCRYINNHAKGKSGAIFIDQISQTSKLSFISCSFEANSAESGDFGGLYINSKGEVLLDNCLFVNCTANKISSSSITPTDTFYIEGSGLWRIKNTNFTKGSLNSDKTNIQISIITENDGSPLRIEFEKCMFSIINPTSSQIYIQNKNDKGSISFVHSSFSRFYTLYDDMRSINQIVLLTSSTDEDEYDHIYVNNECIGQISVNNSCFDTNEDLITKSSTDVLDVVFNNNTINEECEAPEFMDLLLIYIGELEMKNKSHGNNPDNNRYEKNLQIVLIVLLVVLAAAAIGIVITIILIWKKTVEKLNAQNMDSQNETEMSQENNLTKTWADFQSQMMTQENPLYTQAKPSILQNPYEDDFEESKWKDLV